MKNLFPAARTIEADLACLLQVALKRVQMAGVLPDAADVLCRTGGSPGLASLVERISAGFPRAAQVRGDRFASVTAGLGLHARAVFDG